MFLTEACLAVGIKVVTNAGGVNISACAAALEKVAKGQGIKLNIATVTGDDLMTQVHLCLRISKVTVSTCTLSVYVAG